MKSVERISLYTLLVVLTAGNFLFLLSSPGRTAIADAAAWLGELGPAEAVKLTDGEKELALRTKSGRLAWGDGDFRQSYTVGFVDISRALNPLMETQAFTDEREALRAEFESAEKDFRAKLEALDQQIRSLERESPEAREKVEEFNRIQEEAREWFRGAVTRRNELDVKHYQQAYRELTSAVNVVADKLGVDIVLRFIPTDKEFKSLDAEQALTEIRLRTAVRYPEKLDITTDVLNELSLQDTER
ncbi:MAG: OmpH family outer membrane protein [Phycisphaerales bacterium]|nr:OmpH family outer membrane protein [Phycisphaerales bacterium]